MTVQTARRKLKQHGYLLQKSRKKNWTQYDYCGYAIWDTSIGLIIEGYRYDYEFSDVNHSIDELEKDETKRGLNIG